MNEDNTDSNTTALTLLPAAPKRKATKSDIIQMIAELEYQRRSEENAKLDAENQEAYTALVNEAKRVFWEQISNGELTDVDLDVCTYACQGMVSIKVSVHDTAKMRTLRCQWMECKTSVYVSRDKILREVREKMEAHRTDHIKLALAEDPALRQGVEELRKQLFND